MLTISIRKVAMKLLFLLRKKIHIMGVAQIREELHEFINHADERILNLIYGMMRADNDELLTKVQQEDLDKRIARHKNGESESYSWTEARAQVEKRG